MPIVGIGLKEHNMVTADLPLDSEKTDNHSLQIDFDLSNFAPYEVSTDIGVRVRVRVFYGLSSPVLDSFFHSVPQEVLLVHPSEEIENYPPIVDNRTWIFCVFAGGESGWSDYELLKVKLVKPSFVQEIRRHIINLWMK